MIPTDFTVPAFQRVPWKRFRNQNSENCPPGAVMRVTDTILVDGEIVALCDKPNNDPQPIFLVNTGPHVVPQYNSSSKPEGTCAPLTHHAGIVRYDDSAGTPVFGEYWGPQNDSWLLTNSTSLGNFLVMGGLQTDPARMNAMQLQAPPENEVKFASFTATGSATGSPLGWNFNLSFTHKSDPLGGDYTFASAAGSEIVITNGEPALFLLVCQFLHEVRFSPGVLTFNVEQGIQAIANIVVYQGILSEFRYPPIGPANQYDSNSNRYPRNATYFANKVPAADARFGVVFRFFAPTATLLQNAGGGDVTVLKL